MTETEFIEVIDCRLPYEDKQRCCDLIELGAGISPNAAFMVLHEICRPPNSSTATAECLEILLAEWSARVRHPIVEIVLPTAIAMVRGESVSVASSMLAMQKISEYKHQFNALSIPYFACDDINGAADTLHQEIVAAWSV